MYSLHIHSNYSLLAGTISIEGLIDRAKKYNLKSLSLTDINCMYGLIQFYKAAKEENIKPILGALIDEPNDKNIYAILIAKNKEGYSDICKIITQRQLEENFSLFRLLKENWQNLFIITPSFELIKNIPIYNNIFAELIAAKSYKRKTRELYNYVKENNIKYVASNPIYFLEKEDYQLHQVVTAIKNNTTIASLSKDDLVDEDFYFAAPQQFENTWRSLPESLSNIKYIIENCEVDLELGKYKHPKFLIPQNETPFSYLWKIAFQGLSEKYKPITEKAVNRLQEELHVIDELGFADYFLIVWDIAKQAKQLGMMMLGRGSAANSLVAYCLGLTQVDPLEHNLFFERFLNLGRASPPDIDLDFSWKERDDIVKYVFDKYGVNYVAMISTTVTFRARSAFREVAKTFGISDREISEFSPYIPWTSAANLLHLQEKFPEARNLKFVDEPWKTIVSIAAKIASFPRHTSIHPGGIVISPKPLTNYTALEYAENKGLGLIITQPDMYSIEELGLVKIDLLSQRSLAVVKDTVEKIKEERKQEIPINSNIFYLNKN